MKFFEVINETIFFPGLIKQVVQHHGQVIYTRATKGDDPVA